MGFKSFLKGFLWFNNMVLLLLGAAVALYAAVLLSEFDKERRGGSEDTPAPPPPPLAPGSDAPSYVDHVVADEPWCAKPPARTREPPPRPAPPRRSNTNQMQTQHLADEQLTNSPPR